METILRRAHEERKPTIVPAVKKKRAASFIGFYAYHPEGFKKAHDLASEFLEYLRKWVKEELLYRGPTEKMELYRLEDVVEGVPAVFVALSEDFPKGTLEGGGFHWLVAKARRFMREKGI